jgi:hypothetical protein
VGAGAATDAPVLAAGLEPPPQANRLSKQGTRSMRRIVARQEKGRGMSRKKCDLDESLTGTQICISRIIVSPCLRSAIDKEKFRHVAA